MRAILIVILILVVLGFAGWLVFDFSGKGASVEINTDKIEQDTEKVWDKSKELIDKADKAITPSESSATPADKT